MLTLRQGVSAALYLFVGALCVWLARAQARPDAREPGSHRAVLAFQAFWLGLAADAVVGSLQLLAAAFDPDGATVAGALAIIGYIFISVMMWGLLTYLLYLFTGRAGVTWWVAGLYALVLIESILFVLNGRTTGTMPTLWGAKTQYANTPSLASALLLTIAFLLPPIGGAIAYGTFAFRLRDPARRLRVATVSLGILVWFLTTIVLTLPGLLSNDAVQGGGRLITLAAILAIVAAYRPPAPIQRWLGIDPARPHASLTPEEREESLRRLLDRLESLI